MRILRRNLVLAGILAALVATQLALREPLATVDPAGPLFPGFDVARARRIEIEERALDGGEPARVALERRDGGWVVPARHDHPAHAFWLDELLAAIKGMRTTNRVTDQASSHGIYGIGEAGVRVRVLAGDGEVLASFVQGASRSRPTEGDAQLSSYVRPEGSDAVYLAPRFGPVATEVDRWVDTRWLALEPKDVRAVEIGGRDPDLGLDDPLERARFARAEDGDGFSREVERLLEAAELVVHVGVAGREPRPEMGLDPGFLELAFELSGGERVELALGEPAPDEEGVYALRRAEPAWVVVLPSETAALLGSRAAAAVHRLRREGDR